MAVYIKLYLILSLISVGEIYAAYDSNDCKFRDMTIGANYLEGMWGREEAEEEEDAGEESHGGEEAEEEAQW